MLAAPERGVGTDEDLLHGILRVGVAEETRALSYQRPPVARHDGLERGVRPLSREFGESFVALGSQNGLARQPSSCGEAAGGHVSVLRPDALLLVRESEGIP